MPDGITMSEVTTIPGSKYDDTTRKDVAIKYAILGNANKVQELTGVPNQTIADWKKTEWFNEIVGEVRAAKREEHIARYTEIIDKGLDVVSEKLPAASAKDASIIVAVAQDKMRVLEQLPERYQDDSKQTLMQLAQQFRAISMARTDRPIIEATVLDDD